MEIKIFLGCILTKLGILYIDILLCGCLIKANGVCHDYCCKANYGFPDLLKNILEWLQKHFLNYPFDPYTIICNFYVLQGVS
jgi:hypothetical protein